MLVSANLWGGVGVERGEGAFCANADMYAQAHGGSI